MLNRSIQEGSNYGKRPALSVSGSPWEAAGQDRSRPNWWSGMIIIFHSSKASLCNVTFQLKICHLKMISYHIWFFQDDAERRSEWCSFSHVEIKFYIGKECAQLWFLDILVFDTYINHSGLTKVLRLINWRLKISPNLQLWVRQTLLGHLDIDVNIKCLLQVKKILASKM